VEPSAPLQLGKVLIIAGLVLAFTGLLLILGAKYSFFGLGRLPGDLAYKGKNVSFYFPIVTSLIVSVALTLLLWLVNWITRK
jgi:predicted Co/Zn/Cd cation transporter (cation efflux family)